ncbi:MAG: hypothetical protein A3J66_00740 [Candidatus Magasanikbacteria bacterium RIFCSPHIGHO2_02_FULL_47_14]|uniref:Colicin V production protein n=1 Tax=Candidatus Magasanikbacteria bacterium RIFCSPHIGHO2_02_FULL_47_14 TaxID=1798680 RepID=A0A1F6LZ10_9BACT|nr:MAG: hypothetical protein A3J66_00740 [Candidatus Magasanikbacteria bacterium RIFCSPHIGHO2_02_FULL_47_14]
MSFVDVVLLIIVGGFGLFGLWFGFIHTLGSLLGTVFGVYVATRYYEPVAQWLVQHTGWGQNLSRVLVFAISFIILNRLVGLVFWLLDKVFSLVTRLPFINSLNRIGGLVFGVVEGLISVGFIIYFLERFPISERISHALALSVVAPFARDSIAVLLPLVPDALRLIRATFDYVESVVR